jgi:uncharacterized protein (TIGR03435 family)
MKKFDRRNGTRGKSFLRAAGLMATAVALAFGMVNGAAGHAQSEGTATYPPGYEFDVSTIYLSKDTGMGGVVGFLTPDSYRARNMTLKSVIREAYDLWGSSRDEMVLGGPKWLDTDRYYITAKLDGEVLDKLKKLSPDQRKAIEYKMERALLADRFKLQTHRETRELPVYTMTIAKGGLKLHEAKPGETYENTTFPYADKFAGGSEKAGQMFRVGGAGPDGQHTMTIYGFGISMAALARGLAVDTGQIVQDKTGLKGVYDFTLTYTMIPFGNFAAAGAPDGQAMPTAPDPNGRPVFNAIQQQLGLKLESTKGQVEVVVIDHVERPSGN